jgi:hypothetical protein
VGAIVGRLVPDPPPAGAAVPFTPALAGLVGETRGFVTSGNLAAARETLARCLA